MIFTENPFGLDVVAVPWRFRGGSGAVPGRFMSMIFTENAFGLDLVAVPRRFRRGSVAVPTKETALGLHLVAVPWRLWGGSVAVPTKLCVFFTAGMVQAPWLSAQWVAAPARVLLGFGNNPVRRKAIPPVFSHAKRELDLSKDSGSLQKSRRSFVAIE